MAQGRPAVMCFSPGFLLTMKEKYYASSSLIRVSPTRAGHSRVRCFSPPRFPALDVPGLGHKRSQLSDVSLSEFSQPVRVVLCEEPDPTAPPEEQPLPLKDLTVNYNEKVLSLPFCSLCTSIESQLPFLNATTQQATEWGSPQICLLATGCLMGGCEMLSVRCRVCEMTMQCVSTRAAGGFLGCCCHISPACKQALTEQCSCAGAVRAAEADHHSHLGGGKLPHKALLSFLQRPS